MSIKRITAEGKKSIPRKIRRTNVKNVDPPQATSTVTDNLSCTAEKRGNFNISQIIPECVQLDTSNKGDFQRQGPAPMEISIVNIPPSPVKRENLSFVSKNSDESNAYYLNKEENIAVDNTCTPDSNPKKYIKGEKISESDGSHIDEVSSAACLPEKELPSCDDKKIEVGEEI